MKSLKSTLDKAVEFLQKKGALSARRDAEELLSFVLKCSRMQLYLEFDRPLIESELEKYREAILRRSKGEPWQYIVGTVEFLGATIAIDKSVLIPRNETEILAHQILEDNSSESKIVWDVCCGSGCIGIALKKTNFKWDVTLSDISRDALRTARKNGENNQVELTFLNGDLLEPFRGQKADIFISNPPYINTQDYDLLDPSVKLFEPRQALESGPSGFEYYERLARDLPNFLNDRAKVYFEIGTGMGERIYRLFSAPCWVDKKVENDWSGHQRFFKAVYQK